jgi:hypothetical protein
VMLELRDVFLGSGDSCDFFRSGIVYGHGLRSKVFVWAILAFRP